MPSLIFNVSTSVWNGTVRPVINTGGSFSGLVYSNTIVSSTVTATVTWTSYTHSNVQHDGLRFNTNVPYGKHNSLDIINLEVYR
jgi:hypothetical protein